MGLAILVVVAFFIVRGGEDTEWKLINFLIIFGSTALGVAVTFIIVHLVDLPEGFPRTLTLVIGIVSGFLGCFIAGAWNYCRSGEIHKGKKGPGTKSGKNVA